VTILVWFRHDLRLHDNAALHAATRRGGAIVPVFIWAPDEEGPWAPASASRWWLHQSLLALDRSLQGIGARLILRCGPTLETLRDLIRHTGATAVFWNRRHEPAVVVRDNKIETVLNQEGIAAENFNSSLLFEPSEVQTKQGRPFQVYTPFWNACRALPAPPQPSRTPLHLTVPTSWPSTLPLTSLKLEPSIDWAGGMRVAWTPGESGADARFTRFLDRALHYSENRDCPDLEGTSSLSPYLHFGEISPRHVWHTIRERFPTLPRGPETFLKELVWREFAHHLLQHFPHTTDSPLREDFTRFPWRSDPKLLRAWQRGRTGYPLVDAGMRQLWVTGWMHNRVRMIVASFLVKHLLIDWREGARWFWDTLVDADLANNTLGWQWTAGCGADAAPFFRIFNPMTQGERFDPEGTYVARWIPELANLPARWIHQPWVAPAEVLQTAGVVLGETYPRPIVDHAAARTAALAALATLRNG